MHNKVFGSFDIFSSSVIFILFTKRFLGEHKEQKMKNLQNLTLNIRIISTVSKATIIKDSFLSVLEEFDYLVKKFTHYFADSSKERTTRPIDIRSRLICFHFFCLVVRVVLRCKCLKCWTNLFPAFCGISLPLKITYLPTAW